MRFLSKIKGSEILPAAIGAVGVVPLGARALVTKFKGARKNR